MRNKMTKLYWNTISNELKDVLIVLMNEPIFHDFYLVGGTALSLQLGHRKSIDIDMFTDVPYDQFDLKEIDLFIKNNFPYVATSDFDLTVGKAYYVGYEPNHLIKLDLFLTDPFVFEKIELDKIRMVILKEIAAMKLEVIKKMGRKKISGIYMNWRIILQFKRCLSFMKFVILILIIEI